MYKNTLALKDNPFAPRWSGEDAATVKSFIRFIRNLDQEPLRLDKCPLVAALFTRAIGDIEERVKEFTADLDQRGYGVAPCLRGYNRVGAVIRGDAGLGKTTLASYFVQIVMKIVPQGEEPWQFVELHFDKAEIGVARDRAKDDAGIAEFEKVLSKTDESGYVCALIDNVTKDTLGRVLDIFRAKTDRTHVFIITTDEKDLLARQIAQSEVFLKPYDLGPLRVTDAVEYAKFRINEFRDPRQESITAASPIFPLTEEFLSRRAIPSDAAAGTPNLTLRVLNALLSGILMDIHKRHAQQGIDVTQMSVEALRQLLSEI
jgi:hypothetical protein